MRIDLAFAKSLWKSNDYSYNRVGNRIKVSNGTEYYVTKSGSKEFIERAEKIRFNSWRAFLKGTTNAERMNWCKEKAKTAKRARQRINENATEQTYQAQLGLSASDVWRVLEKSKGICHHCGSLALEKQPSGSWQYMGRRIGSLDHIKPLNRGGDNNEENLVWSCMMCNSHEVLIINGKKFEIRKRFAKNFGGYYPKKKLVGMAIKNKIQHEKALKRIYQLMQMEIHPGSKEEKELEMLVSLAEAYEQKHFPVLEIKSALTEAFQQVEKMRKGKIKKQALGEFLKKL